MVSKNEIKLIKSLTQKKYRNKYLLFVAEGEKLVNELVKSRFKIKQIYTLENRDIDLDKTLVKFVTEKELRKISNLVTPNSMLGVFEIPAFKKPLKGGLQILLDGIKDPGNLGTIIRLCDWFGVSQLICSDDTVDCFNPKVVQATMGSIVRVNITYVDIVSYLEKSEMPKYMTLMQGDSIYRQSFPNDAIIVMGNEANGIRPSIQKLADYRITIPKFDLGSNTESLNVATATAVLLSEFRR